MSPARWGGGGSDGNPIISMRDRNSKQGEQILLIYEREQTELSFLRFKSLQRRPKEVTLSTTTQGLHLHLTFEHVRSMVGL